MQENLDGAPRQVIDLTRESDVAYWCRIFDVSIERLREAVHHAGHEPAHVRRYLSGSADAAPPAR
jgi:hypothetical protein